MGHSQPSPSTSSGQALRGFVIVFIEPQDYVLTTLSRSLGLRTSRPELEVVLRARLDQGEKLSARVLLVEDSYHGRGHG